MEEKHKKDVDRPLTTDEIRLHAHKWTLAGDVGLLAHLEQFSQNLLNKSTETQKNINSLLDSFEDTSTKVNNVTNQFLALQNSQFVENRVHDDDTPTEEPKIEVKISKEEHEKQLLAQYKEAVEIGVKLLDTHFEEVQLPPNSDSDEEEVSIENAGLVWKPKNAYSNRRFPLLIGSAEWWADDNVGLGEYEENVNPDTLSSEYESDLEAENNPEKRIRMSSSSSTDSEKVLPKKPKEQIINQYDDIFAPVERDLFSVQSDLYKNDEDDEVPGIRVAPAARRSVKNVEDEIVVDKSMMSKESDSSLFNNSENGYESTIPVAKQRKMPNAFTEELTAKLSTVANNNNNNKDEPKPKPRATLNKEQSALFADYDDNDDLFSAKSPNSNPLFKKQSIFSDVDGDDQLFGDSENLFSGTSKESKPASNLEVNVKENNRSKQLDKSVKFADDDLFSNNNDLLFSNKSMLNSSQNSGETKNIWKDSEKVKFSTPTEVRHSEEVPDVDIFGGVSEIESNNSFHAENVSAIINQSDNSLNYSPYNDSSKDLGFVEPSGISENKSEKFESPDSFDPAFSSTRHMPVDTSDYKTFRSVSNATSHPQTNSISANPENNSKTKMGHMEKTHFSREQSDANKVKGIFDDEDEDDLFQISKPSKPAKENNSLFDDIGNDDLFGNIPKANTNRTLFEEKGDNILFQKSVPPPLDNDEDEKSLSIDRSKQQDSVSISSSRSSLFDDVNVGKTNLASVFDNDKSVKNNLFSKTDDNLFSENKTFDQHDPDDLFSEDAVFKSKISNNNNNNNVKNLFEDLEDADDLFRASAPKKIFENIGDDDDLFAKGEPGKNSDVKKASQNDKKLITDSDSENKLFDDVFNETKKNYVKENTIEQTSKSQSTVTSIFTELDDEEDDLFGSPKPKEDSKHSTSINVTNKQVEKKIFENDDDDVDIFQEIYKAKPEESSNITQGKNKTDEVLNNKSKLFDEPNSLLTNNIDISNDNENNSDLFENRTKKSSVLENKKLFESDDNSLFSSKTKENRLPNDKSEDGIRPSPPNTLNIQAMKKLITEGKQDSSETDSAANTERPRVVGKLSIPANLKINPMSLLPGAVAKKSVAAESECPTEEHKAEKDASLDTEAAPNLLKCLNKDRVKIQMRRRPQTRKARHEALRTSGIDFEAFTTDVSSSRSKSVDDFDSDDMVSPTVKSSSDTNMSDSVLVNSVEELDSKTADSSSSIFHSVDNSPEPLFSSPLVSNPLSPSTDEEDYFNVPELDVNFEREDQSIFKSNVNDSQSNKKKNDDTLLFDGAPILSPMESKSLPEERPTLKNSAVIGKMLNNRVTVDDDEEEEDDDDGDSLFKPSAKTVEKKKAVVNSVQKVKTDNIFDDLDDGDSFLFQKNPVDVVNNKKSLFDDNDEDDDLFGEKSVPTSSINKVLNDSSIVKSKVNKTVTEKPKQPFVDPLGLMTNPD